MIEVTIHDESFLSKDYKAIGDFYMDCLHKIFHYPDSVVSINGNPITGKNLYQMMEEIHQAVG